jgi:anti-sigma B factor antagonist/stage II sporulation protein AA (anti-sigma F factor antagonist)
MTIGTFIGFYQITNYFIEGKMKEFELKSHFGYLVATLNLKKATILEAIEFKSILDDEINKGQHNIIINLNDCELIDSTFIGVLVVTWKKLRARGGKLKLVKLRGFTHSVFHLTGTVEIFEQYETVEEALGSFITPIEEYYSAAKTNLDYN